MPEVAEIQTETTQTEQAPTKQTEQPTIAKRGKVERAPVAQFVEEEIGKPVENKTTQAAPTAEKPAEEAQAPELSEDQIAAIFKAKGVKFDGWDKLKEKTETQTQAAPTEEELKEKEKAFEKRMLDRFIEKGGTAEQYVALKAVATAKVDELSQSELTRELKEQGFTDDEIPEIIKQRYFQNALDNIEIGEDETVEEFEARKAKLEKLVKYGAKKLANRSSYLKSQAEQLLNSQKAELESEDAEKQEEIKFSTQVDAYFKELPRKTSIELGEVAEGLQVDPIEYDLQEDAIKQASKILKDPQKLKQLLFNQDGSPNLKNLADLLVSNYIAKDAQKKVYATALTRNTRAFRQIFPAQTASELGVNGSTQKNNQGKGPATGYGKPQLVR